MQFNFEIDVDPSDELTVRESIAGILIGIGKNERLIWMEREKLKELQKKIREFLMETSGEKKSAITMEELFEDIRQRLLDKSREGKLTLDEAEEALDDAEARYEQSKHV